MSVHRLYPSIVEDNDLRPIRLPDCQLTWHIPDLGKLVPREYTIFSIIREEILNTTLPKYDEQLRVILWTFGEKQFVIENSKLCTATEKIIRL